jgi:hypothetical protein
MKLRSRYAAATNTWLASVVKGRKKENAGIDINTVTNIHI